METMMPTSFIPKRPVSSDPVTPEQHSHRVGLFSLLTSIIVIATAVSYGGVFLYQKQLLVQKARIDDQINEARKGIGTEFLADMKRLNARIDGVKTTIDNHIVVTPIFAALEQTTLRSIQYTSFDYEFMKDIATPTPMVEVTLDGTAKSYALIALQSDTLSKSTLIKNPIFSDLNVDEKTNAVNFKLTFAVPADALSYEKFIARSLPGSQSADPSMKSNPPTQ